RKIVQHPAEDFLCVLKSIEGKKARAGPVHRFVILAGLTVDEGVQDRLVRLSPAREGLGVRTGLQVFKLLLEQAAKLVVKLGSAGCAAGLLKLLDRRDRLVDLARYNVRFELSLNQHRITFAALRGLGLDHRIEQRKGIGRLASLGQHSRQVGYVADET